MKRAGRFILVASLVVAALDVTSYARAQTQTQVQTQVTAQVVEVGKPFQVQIKASGTEKPSNPRLKVPRGFSVSGPSVGTSQQMSITNGQVSRTVGVTATWQLTASKTGNYTIGPATVTTAQGTVSGKAFQINVVPKGQAPQPKRRRRSIFDDDPLPGFGGFGRSIFDDIFQNRGSLGQPEAPEEYRIEAAPDDVAFLHAKLDKKQVVIGEQVTLKIFGYGGRGRFNENDPSEPRRPNFYSFPILERSGRERVYVTNIGERQFHVAKLREIALFPLSTGRQEIGPMTIKFYGSRYLTRVSPEGLERKSLPVTVEVVEPPSKGRPTGYRIGDVGNYRLEVDVSPRKLSAGGSASVVATLKGIGNLPTQLLTPEQHGVEWLTPTVKGELQALKDRRIGGSRTFNYVVRLSKAGTIDLGELALPFYNPQSKRYNVARAKLGNIVVAPNSASVTAQQSVEPPKLSAETEVRREQRALQTDHAPMADQLWFWLLAFGGPLSILTSQAALDSLQKLRRRRRGRAESFDQRIRDALDAARAASRTGNSASMVTETERAIFLKIEDSTGLRARAILKDQLEAKLVNAGLSAEHASSIVELLNEMESIRFAGAEQETDTLPKRVQKLLKQLPSRTGKEPG